MKILYVSPKFPNHNSSAAETRVNNIIPLLQNKCDLKVFSFPVRHSKLPEFIDSHQLVTTYTKKSFVHDFINTLFSTYPRTVNRHAHYDSIYTFTSIVEEFRPDIIHLDTLHTLGFAPYTNRIPTIFHIHDCQTKQIKTRILPKNGWIHAIDTYIQYLKIRNFERKKYRNANVCIVDTDTDADYLLELNEKINIKVVPLGYDPEVYNNYGIRENLDTYSIIFSGSMNSVQTVEAVEDLILYIMPLVWHSIPTARLYLVGANPHPKITKMATKDHRVHLTGYVENLANYIRGASVYACPLKVGSGMKTRVIEALAAGAAMVSTTEGVQGLSKPEHQTELPYITASSFEDMANNIINLLNDSDFRNKLSENAARFAKKQYSWASVADKIFSIYSDLH